MASPDKVIIYTTTHCPDCQRAKRFLEYVGVPYHEINVDEDAEARQVVRKHNDRKREISRKSSVASVSQNTGTAGIILACFVARRYFLRAFYFCIKHSLLNILYRN